MKVNELISSLSQFNGDEDVVIKIQAILFYDVNGLLKTEDGEVFIEAN